MTLEIFDSKAGRGEGMTEPSKQEKLEKGIDTILEAGDMMLNPPDDMAEFIDKAAIKKSRLDQLISLLADDGLGWEGTSYYVSSHIPPIPKFIPIVKIEKEVEG